MVDYYCMHYYVFSLFHILTRFYCCVSFYSTDIVLSSILLSLREKNMFVWSLCAPFEKDIFSGLIYIPYVCRQLLAWILPIENRGREESQVIFQKWDEDKDNLARLFTYQHTKLNFFLYYAFSLTIWEVSISFYWSFLPTCVGADPGHYMWSNEFLNFCSYCSLGRILLAYKRFFSKKCWVMASGVPKI